MDKTGRKKDVIVTIIPRGGDPKEYAWTPFGPMRSRGSDEVDCLEVWADKGLVSTISSVPGIMGVNVMPVEVKYVCLIDPRYDTDFVAREVEAAILTYAPPVKKEESALKGYSWRKFGGFDFPRNDNISGFFRTDGA